MPDLIIYTLPSEEQGCTQHFSELILLTRFGQRGGRGSEKKAYFILIINSLYGCVEELTVFL